MSENKVKDSQLSVLPNLEPEFQLQSQKGLPADLPTQLAWRKGPQMHLQTHAQPGLENNQQGFTLVELVVAIGVGILLLSVVVSFCSRTAKILQRLKIQREIRDSGLLAVESIERSFRKALEYGGRIAGITGTQISARGPEYSVSLSFDEHKGELELKVTKLEDVEGAGGSGNTEAAETTVTYWSGESLRCSNVRVKALVGNSYINGSNPDALSGQVVVIEFELGEDVYGISRPFKAAFAVYGGGGS